MESSPNCSSLGHNFQASWLLVCIFKNGPSSASFFFIFIFSIQLTLNVQYNFANDWIRTTDPEHWRQPLYQLSHNRCSRLLVFFFLKMGQSRPLFVYFHSFLVTISIQIEKAQMVCLGFEPGAAGWQAQTKPQSYGGHIVGCCLLVCLVWKRFCRLRLRRCTTELNWPPR